MKLWKNKKKFAGAVFIIGVVTFNYLAWMHANAMMQFSSEGLRTKKPESLSIKEKIQTLLLGVNITRPKNRSTLGDYGFSFETHRYSSGTGHTLEAWYLPAPLASKIVLLFHGYASSKESLIPLAVGFHSLGYDSFLVDFYGSGGSNGNSTSVGFYEAEDVLASVSYVQKRWPDRSAVLYGVSMGGASILRAIAVESVYPDGVILESTFDKLLNSVKNRFKLMGLPSFPAAELLLFWGGWQRGFNAFSHNPVEYARKVKSPALVLHGGKDSRVSLQQAKQVFQSLAGQKRFISYPDTGHQLIVKRNRDKWKKDVSKFLESL